MNAFTCITCVDDELSWLKCPGLTQTLAAHAYAAGVSDLRLADHNSNRAAGNVATILLDVHQVLTDLLRNK